MGAEENSSLPEEQREASEPAPQLSETLTGGNSEPAIAPGFDPIPLQPHSKWLPPENYNVPWGWLDVVLIVPIALAMIFVIALVIIGSEIAFFHARPSYLREHMSFLLISAQIVMEIGLLGYLALQVRNRDHLPFWPTIGWRPLRPRTVSRAAAHFWFIVAGVGLAFLVAGASALFPPSHPLPIEKIFATRPLTILFMATAVLVAPLVEETIFRGYLYPVAARSFGVVGGIIFTGAVFGLLHGSQLWGGWWQIGLLVIVGIVFTFARAATRTNVSSFLLHISYNGVQVLGVLYAMYGPRHILHLH
ncbi:MAG: lysostaphin resistance A-like protein [Candidatus Acidiferrales bacterium]